MRLPSKREANGEHIWSGNGVRQTPRWPDSADLRDECLGPQDWAEPHVRPRVRSIVIALVPPIVVSAIRRLRDRQSARSEWAFVGTEWPVEDTARGWNVPSVVGAQRSRWAELEGAMRNSSLMTEGGVGPQNTLACFGYVVGRAASGQSKLSILDWGGGLGQYGLIARSMFPALEIEYHCYDLPLMTEAGRTLLPKAQFHDDEAESVARSYDLVMASASLQYARDWRAALRRLARAAGTHLYVTRLPCVLRASAFVVVQRPDAYGYNTEYPGWVLNRDDFLSSAMSAGMVLKREFLLWEQPHVPGAPEQPVYRGFLFERLRGQK